MRCRMRLAAVAAAAAIIPNAIACGTLISANVAKAQLTPLDVAEMITNPGS